MKREADWEMAMELFNRLQERGLEVTQVTKAALLEVRGTNQQGEGSRRAGAQAGDGGRGSGQGAGEGGLFRRCRQPCILLGAEGERAGYRAVVAGWSGPRQEAGGSDGRRGGGVQILTCRLWCHGVCVGACHQVLLASHRLDEARAMVADELASGEPLDPSLLPHVINLHVQSGEFERSASQPASHCAYAAPVSLASQPASQWRGCDTPAARLTDVDELVDVVGGRVWWAAPWSASGASWS